MKKLILKYKVHKRLGKFVGDVNLGEINNMNAVELNELLIEIKEAIESRHSTIAIDCLVLALSSTYENMLTSFTPIRAKGISNALMSNEDFMCDIDFLAMEYINGFDISPEKRVIGTILKTTISLHVLNSMNSENDDMKKNMLKIVSDDVKEKYKDL